MINGGISIIADPKSKAWSFAKGIYDILAAKSNGVIYELNEIETKVFRDGEILPIVQKNVRGKTCFFIHDSNKNPSEWFTTLAFINEALKKSSAGEIIDVLPYLRYSRQDSKDRPRAPISAAVIGDVIGLYTDAVLTLDVHNPAIDGAYDIRFDNLQSFNYVVKYLKDNNSEILDNLVVMSPDAGGAKRARAFANRLGIADIAIGNKYRKVPGEVAQLNVIGDVEGKNVIMVDDIIDSGSTLVKASEAVRKNGARKVYAYATHGLFTEGTDKLLAAFDKVFISDSVYQQPSDKLKIISFVPLFAEAINRISHGDSLSALFD